MSLAPFWLSLSLPFCAWYFPLSRQSASLSLLLWPSLVEQLHSLVTQTLQQPPQCKHPLKLHPFHSRPKFVAKILFPWLVISVVLQSRLVRQVTTRELASHACSGRPRPLLPYRMFFKANNNIATVRSSRGRSHSISRRYIALTTGPTWVSARSTNSIKSKLSFFSIWWLFLWLCLKLLLKKSWIDQSGS